MFHSTQTFPDRFFAHVDMWQGECWGWHGKVDRYGYGAFWADQASGTQKAHRVAYELLVGPIPDGLVIDHLCRSRACVNPSHMEPVTNAENVRRGILATPPKTYCVNGHLLDDHNTYTRPDRGRRCRACARAWDRVRKARKRRAKVPGAQPTEATSTAHNLLLNVIGTGVA